MSRSLFVGALVTMSGIAVGCGGESEPAKSADAVNVEDEVEARRAARHRSMEASQEVGALDDDAVNDVFQGSVRELERCLQDGSSRIEVLGGEIKFFLKIGEDGNLVHAHAEKSTIGDRETERCMLDVLRAQSWPRPVGGPVGIARNGVDFSTPQGERPPTAWTSGRIAGVVQRRASDIQGCRHGVKGKFTATLYVDTDGSPLGVGMAPPDEDGEEAIDCLVGVLMDAKYPSPGSWPAKVTFRL